MRIAVISAPAERQPPPDYVKALAKGMESVGHKVDIFNAWTDNGMRLPGYDYIIVVMETLSFFSAKIPDIIPKILSSGMGLSGKKSGAFIKKGGLRNGRTLINLMNAMEAEGLLVNLGDILLSAPHAEAMGKRIGT